MRARTVLFVLAAAVLVVLALLNGPELARPSPINLVWRTVNLPLGLVLLGLLALVWVASLASGVALRARHRRELQSQEEALKSQRDLADRAEASRFLDLRQTLDTHLREARQRETALPDQLEQALGKHQRELRNQMEGLHRALATRMGEMEARLDSQLRRAPAAPDWPASPTQAATRQPGELAPWHAGPEGGTDPQPPQAGRKT
jgi:hypothetical protein